MAHHLFSEDLQVSRSTLGVGKQQQQKKKHVTMHMIEKEV